MAQTLSWRKGVAWALVAVLGAGAGAQAQASQTLGYVIAGWREPAEPDLPDNVACPDGMQAGNEANFNAQFPTEEARKRQLSLYGTLDNRGPHGENVWFEPDSVTDPLPFKEVGSNIGIGLDLDGATNGAKVPPHRAHEEFVSPDGEQGIDNQLYRVLGCQKGYRKTGFFTGFNDNFIRDSYDNRILLEITGVDDLKNDPDVDVGIYLGRSPLLRTGSGGVLPWQTQEVDPDTADYVHHLKGRITNGVLETVPQDIVWPVDFHGSEVRVRPYLFRDLRFRLTLSDDGATGLMGGYHDLNNWWAGYFKLTLGGAKLAGASAPTVWAAAKRYADGYPDSKTGQCTAISTAVSVSFVRVLIRHDAIALESTRSFEGMP